MTARRTRRRCRPIGLAVGAALVAGGVVETPPAPVAAQETPPPRPHHHTVLVRTGDPGPGGPLPADTGVAGLGQQLRKLGTTASVLYTAGHPDDEEAGVLTLLSRGLGARTALLTLTRGEGGANAIGAELFDALGLVRTEELRLSGRWYGLDDQYFTTAADYGYSKTLDEAFRSWDREAVLADMVRIIRMNRPLVVISRWHGSARDGHGHHQATGVLTPEAVDAAADPDRFPEQITREGLRPWRVPLAYRSRIREDEAADVTLDPGVPAPSLGTTYQEFGDRGLSLQRSQTGGRIRAFDGDATVRYERIRGDAGAAPGHLFGDLDTSWPGVYELVGETPPRGAVALLLDAAGDARAATAALETAAARSSASTEETASDDASPAPRTAVVPHLARALEGLRRARDRTRPGHARFLLDIEVRETERALATALGLSVDVTAVPRGAPAGTPLGPVVPGTVVDVRSTVRHVGPGPVDVRSTLRWAEEPAAPALETAGLAPGQAAADLIRYRIPDGAEPDRPWFHRDGIGASTYQVRDSSAIHLGETPPRAILDTEVSVPLEEGGTVPLTVRTPLRTLVPDRDGGAREILTVAPAVDVRVSPDIAVVRPGREGPRTVAVSLTSHARRPLDVHLALDTPDGWTATGRDLTLAPGERTLSRVELGSDASSRGPGAVTVVATVEGREYREGATVIAHSDLAVKRLYAPAVVELVPVDVVVPDGLRVGYVMGVGDEVPAALEELGAAVTLLEERDLERGAYDAYDAVVIGTRAYAVRDDLVEHDDRLLEWVRQGGNLVVLYQTPEYDPSTQAPVTATLPGDAEEVSEEDAPVRILAPDHPMLTTPNRIGDADFEGWVEQRGSKFFATWDPAYTPLVETHDTGQRPQRGVWLTAPVGAGRFTYVALALHRQLPYGVPGAYRILANLLAAGGRE